MNEATEQRQEKYKYKISNEKKQIVAQRGFWSQCFFRWCFIRKFKMQVKSNAKK